MSSFWLLSLPNEGRTSDESFNRLKSEIASKHDYCSLFPFALPPNLLIGTLDSLLSLSDDLIRVDNVIENIVKKIERQFHELNNKEEPLTIDDVPIERYISHFSWDESKFPHRRPLPEIVNNIHHTLLKTEEELKQLSTMYTEKKQLLLLKQRKKGGSLIVADLDEILTKNVVSKNDFVNSEYLQTVVAIIPKNIEEHWKTDYMKIGNDIVEYGNPETANSLIKGSPVVPNSLRKILEEGESSLYLLVMLKGHYEKGYIGDDNKFEPGHVCSYFEEFQRKAKEKRYVIRSFTYNPQYEQNTEQVIATLEVEVDRLWSGLLRWCQAHYGEAFIAWMHVKAVRIFTESVLRYGLPVNMLAVVLRPNSGKEKRIHNAIQKLHPHLEPTQLFNKHDDSSNQADHYSYVFETFTTDLA